MLHLDIHTLQLADQLLDLHYAKDCQYASDRPPPPFSCPGETELTCAPPGYGQGMSGVRKILQSLTEKHLLRTLKNMKKMKKNNKMNCYLAVISTCILQFCENSGKFLKALSHTWDRTGDSLNTIKLVVNKPTQIYIVL